MLCGEFGPDDDPPLVRVYDAGLVMFNIDLIACGCC